MRLDRIHQFWPVPIWLCLGHFATHAAIITNAWVPGFKGVDYTTGQADTNEVRQQKVFAFRVDLLEPTVQFFSTPSNGTNGAMEAYGQTTTTFVNTFGASVGINANFFSPVTMIPNDPRELSGLAISQGNLVSTYDSGYPALLLTRSNNVSIINADLGDYSAYWTAVAGSDRILINGIAQLSTCTNSFCLENPRSAIGYSLDKRYLYMMVIDGRQPGWSDGATLYETGQWLFRLGAWNGLNLDGGGSSTIAKIESGSAVLINKPSGGTQRVDGNHLGFFAAPLAPVILAQPQTTNQGLSRNVTFAVTAGGTTPLRFQWRFNGTNIASATASTFARSNLQLSQFGYYSVFITNTAGVVTSSLAALICTNTPSAPSIDSHLVLSNGMRQVLVTADPGRMYSLQVSPNLVQWLTLTNYFNQQPTFQMFDLPPENWPQRYYRMRWSEY